MKKSEEVIAGSRNASDQAERPLLFPMGTRWSYTNSGLYLLGLVVEAVSGKSYAEYLQENEFRPFTMTIICASVSTVSPLFSRMA
jgi:CubicO group peptidase (beta-lactamase class C family)